MAGIFRAYDVRGHYPEQINPEIAYAIGGATVEQLSAHSMVVGHDNRLSSQVLHQALIRGIREQGCDCIDIDLCSTPMNYWAVSQLEADGGIMVTASHNPAGDNGCKISGRDAVALIYEGELAEIEKRVRSGVRPRGTGAGRMEHAELLAAYQHWIAGFAGPTRPLRLVIDTGNGVMGWTLPGLLERLPCNVSPLFFELDGSFPHHNPDPFKPENTRALQAEVRTRGADLGVAFDGDGDRVVFIAENGAVIPGDVITAMLAAEFLRREPGATILYDLRSSRMVPEEIARLGGTPVEIRVGHSYIKRTLRERNAVFAGELSGHYYFRDAFFTDNGEMAMLMVISLLSRAKGPMSTLVASFSRYFDTGELSFEVKDREACMAALSAAFPSAQVTRLDGLTLQLPDLWFNVRSSNTEPSVRLNLEARTALLRDEARAKIEAILARS